MRYRLLIHFTCLRMCVGYIAQGAFTDTHMVLVVAELTTRARNTVVRIRPLTAFGSLQSTCSSDRVLIQQRPTQEPQDIPGLLDMSGHIFGRFCQRTAPVQMSRKLSTQPIRLEARMHLCQPAQSFWLSPVPPMIVVPGGHSLTQACALWSA